MGLREEDGGNGLADAAVLVCVSVMLDTERRYGILTVPVTTMFLEIDMEDLCCCGQEVRCPREKAEGLPSLASSKIRSIGCLEVVL